jgi:hypothetical protein
MRAGGGGGGGGRMVRGTHPSTGWSMTMVTRGRGEGEGAQCVRRGGRLRALQMLTWEEGGGESEAKEEWMGEETPVMASLGCRCLSH